MPITATAGTLRDMEDILILLPAAGASSRMRGRDKLLETINGQPLLARQTARALATGAPVCVTIPKDSTLRINVLGDVSHVRLSIVPIEDATEGMAVSIRAGAALAKALDVAGLMILPADMPDIDTDDLVRLGTAFAGDPTHVHRASSADGMPGHPVIFPARLFADLAALHGDRGARIILAHEPVRLIRLAGTRALTDLDTPEDWAMWRATRKEN